MLKHLFIVFSLLAINIVIGTNISYTIESFTQDRQLCMTDCINGSCITQYNGRKHICQPGRTLALHYYTSRERTRNKLCKSRCGRFDDTEYDWCLVSANEWDYCNSMLGTRIVKHKAFTKSLGPCKDECEYRGENYLWCNTYWNRFNRRWDYCETEEFTYMLTKTRPGRDCVGICGDKGHIKYNWCVDTRGTRQSCAPPARNFRLLNSIFDSVDSVMDKKFSSCYYENVLEGSRYVSSYAELLEYPNAGLLTENVLEPGNPVYRYTVMPYGLLGDPMIPLVVRARITPDTLKTWGSRTSVPPSVRENLQRMGIKFDENDYNNETDGHIISYMLGGPAAIYNFKPQTQNLKSDNDSAPFLWHDMQNSIYEFVFKTRGWVEITVLVVYSDLPKSWIPQGYAVDVGRYYPDNSLEIECLDLFYAIHQSYPNLI